MKASEFIKNMSIVGEDADELIEIRTIQQLPPPTKEIISRVKDIAINPVEYYEDIYWGMIGSLEVVVALKKDDELLAYTIGVLTKNSRSSEFSTYMTPKNLYSWANDRGASALKVIRALLSISPYPVLSDIELSPPAKKFLKRKVETGELNGQIFNLKSGQVSAYDPDIWETDDEERVLFMEYAGRNHLTESLLMPTGTWNWRQINDSRILNSPLNTIL